VDSWVRHEVGLELSDINVQGSVESEGGSEGRDNLGNESVEVGVGRSLDIKVSSGDVIDGLVVKHNGNISMLEKRVGGEHRVVWLNNSSGNLRGWVDSEAKLGFLTVVNGKSLKEKGSESRSSSSSNGVEDDESLESSTVIGQLSDSVKTEVDDFFTNGIVSSGEVKLLAASSFPEISCSGWNNCL